MDHKHEKQSSETGTVPQYVAHEGPRFDAREADLDPALGWREVSRSARSVGPITRDLALHLRNIAALIDANVPADRFDDEVRTLLCIYGWAALRALDAEDALDDPKGVAALRRYSHTCPECHYDVDTAGTHSPACELGASS